MNKWQWYTLGVLLAGATLSLGIWWLKTGNTGLAVFDFVVSVSIVVNMVVVRKSK